MGQHFQEGLSAIFKELLFLPGVNVYRIHLSLHGSVINSKAPGFAVTQFPVKVGMAGGAGFTLHDLSSGGRRSAHDNCCDAKLLPVTMIN